MYHSFVKQIRGLIKRWGLCKREEMSLWALWERANLAHIDRKRDQENFKYFMDTCVPAWWIWIPRSNRHKVNWYAYISSFPWYPYPVCNSSISKSRSRVAGLRKYLQVAWNFFQMISILTKTGSRALKFRESSHNAHSITDFLAGAHQKKKAG